jgi:hypothetical protein
MITMLNTIGRLIRSSYAYTAGVRELADLGREALEAAGVTLTQRLGIRRLTPTQYRIMCSHLETSRRWESIRTLFARSSQEAAAALAIDNPRIANFGAEFADEYRALLISVYDASATERRDFSINTALRIDADQVMRELQEALQEQLHPTLRAPAMAEA